MSKVNQAQSVPHSALLNAAIQSALEAGSLLREGFTSSFNVSCKSGRHDLVTDFDIKAEKLIIEKLSHIFPEHAFLGEESGNSQKQNQENEKTILWVIDPIDGTVNFARHIPFFSVSIAATFKGEILCGVVYNPMTHELFTAQKDGGAFLNGKKMTVSSTQNLNDCFFATGLPSNLKENPHHCIELLQGILQLGVPLRRLGSAAIDLAYVAAGRFDAFWEVILRPWDVAAGVLLVQEAGGKVSTLDGKPFELTDPVSLMASNPHLHQPILQTLLKKRP